MTQAEAAPPRTPARRALHALVAIATSLVFVLALGGLPGSPVREVVRDLVAPPVPIDVKERDGALDVTVTDGADGSPLAGARVRALALIAGQAYLAATRETDRAGVAHLTTLPHGEAWVLADVPGHARGSTRLVVEAGPRAVRIELAVEHAFDVVVRDEQGAAVPAAEVEVTQAGDPLPVGARADTSGATHVGRLSAGPWHVVARAPGYEDASSRAAHDGEVVRLVLRKLGGIDVEVRDEQDHTVPGAHVEVAGAMLWPPRSAVTGDGGHVLLGSLAAGSYAVRATAGERVSPIELGVMLARGERKTAGPAPDSGALHRRPRH